MTTADPVPPVQPQETPNWQQPNQYAYPRPPQPQYMTPAPQSGWQSPQQAPSGQPLPPPPGAGRQPSVQQMQQAPWMTPQQPMPSDGHEDKGSVGWLVLSLFVPLAGLILWLVWRKDRPRTAKRAGLGALIGAVVSIVSAIVIGIALPRETTVTVKDGDITSSQSSVSHAGKTGRKSKGKDGDLKITTKRNADGSADMKIDNLPKWDDFGSSDGSSDGASNDDSATGQSDAGGITGGECADAQAVFDKYMLGGMNSESRQYSVLDDHTIQETKTLTYVPSDPSSLARIYDNSRQLIADMYAGDMKSGKLDYRIILKDSTGKTVYDKTLHGQAR